MTERETQWDAETESETSHNRTAYIWLYGMKTNRDVGSSPRKHLYISTTTTYLIQSKRNTKPDRPRTASVRLGGWIRAMPARPQLMKAASH